MGGVTTTSLTIQAKIGEIKECPLGEICWCFTDSWEQFRMSSIIDVIDGSSPDPAKLQQREKAWFASSVKSSSQYLGPCPGIPVANDDHIKDVHIDPSAGPVDAYCLLTLDPEKGCIRSSRIISIILRITETIALQNSMPFFNEAYGYMDTSSTLHHRLFLGDKSERGPAEIPWVNFGTEYVVEFSGVTTIEKASVHLKACTDHRTLFGKTLSPNAILSKFLRTDGSLYPCFTWVHLPHIYVSAMVETGTGRVTCSLMVL